MRIVSLLPSATEIVYALGLEDELVGVTHECDYPAQARHKTIVSHSALAPEADPAEIDRLVSASLGEGDPIYRLDRDAIGELAPELILTQDLCAVCAVPSGHVHEALDRLGCQAQVLSLDPNTLFDVFDCVRQVGEVTGSQSRANELVDELTVRVGAVADAVAGCARVDTFALEWPDPPFNGGHWVPEMITLAGGNPVLGSPGSPSVRLDWSQIAQVEAPVVVFMPCGFDLAGALAVAQPLLGRPELAHARSIVVVDANAYFSRPGPRLADGVELLAHLLHPGSVPAPSSEGYAVLR
jgi:iron complex transport system substrate-binding protein